MSDVGFANLVGATRQARNMSLRNLGKIVGVRAPYIMRVERGEFVPSPAVVRRIATELGLSKHALVKLAEKALVARWHNQAEDPRGTKIQKRAARRLHSRADHEPEP